MTFIKYLLTCLSFIYRKEKGVDSMILYSYGVQVDLSAASDCTGICIPLNVNSFTDFRYILSITVIGSWVYKYNVENLRNLEIYLALSLPLHFKTQEMFCKT